MSDNVYVASIRYGPWYRPWHSQYPERCEIVDGDYHEWFNYDNLPAEYENIVNDRISHDEYDLRQEQNEEEYEKEMANYYQIVETPPISRPPTPNNNNNEMWDDWDLN